MQPDLTSSPPLLLRATATGAGPSVCHGAVETLYFTVCLWTVGSRAFRSDPQLLAYVAPESRTVRAAVVRQNSFYFDAPFLEPLDSSAQDLDGGDDGLVVMNLGVGHA